MCEILHVEGANLSTCVTEKTQYYVHNEHTKKVELMWGRGRVLDELTVWSLHLMSTCFVILKRSYA